MSKVRYEWHGRKFHKLVEFADAKASTEVANFVLGEAMARCPVGEVAGGNLVNSGTFQVKEGHTARVGFTAKYAADVEYGTKPHIISIKNKRVLTDGKTFFGTVVKHPGTTAQPFLRPAVWSNIARIVDIYKKVYEAVILK